MLVPVVLIVGPVLVAGGKYNRSIWIFAPLAFGLLDLALTVESQLSEQLMTMAGALLLIMAHIKNRTARKISS
ncbi:hypothetical protein J4G78_04800 [Parasphingorhabdus cellanae]|uniref:Uncharacterized protein n=1 Tax=Parasphingorhabdus cellanae TaxID=2806553 RepID=A0ABX7T993_9SPHN|nr:hypothetical protein J4G78_04800 [Parasphingorhabdus cellanae]